MTPQSLLNIASFTMFARGAVGIYSFNGGSVGKNLLSDLFLAVVCIIAARRQSTLVRGILTVGSSFMAAANLIIVGFGAASYLGGGSLFPTTYGATLTSSSVDAILFGYVTWAYRYSCAVKEYEKPED